jgi:hypothetical protein
MKEPATAWKDQGSVAVMQVPPTAWKDQTKEPVSVAAMQAGGPVMSSSRRTDAEDLQSIASNATEGTGVSDEGLISILGGNQSSVVSVGSGIGRGPAKAQRHRNSRPPSPFSTGEEFVDYDQVSGDEGDELGPTAKAFHQSHELPPSGRASSSLQGKVSASVTLPSSKARSTRRHSRVRVPAPFAEASPKRALDESLAGASSSISSLPGRRSTSPPPASTTRGRNALKKAKSPYAAPSPKPRTRKRGSQKSTPRRSDADGRASPRIESLRITAELHMPSSKPHHSPRMDASFDDSPRSSSHHRHHVQRGRDLHHPQQHPSQPLQQQRLLAPHEAKSRSQSPVGAPPPAKTGRPSRQPPTHSGVGARAADAMLHSRPVFYHPPSRVDEAEDEGGTVGIGASRLPSSVWDASALPAAVEKHPPMGLVGHTRSFVAPGVSLTGPVASRRRHPVTSSFPDPRTDPSLSPRGENDPWTNRRLKPLAGNSHSNNSTGRIAMDSTDSLMKSMATGRHELLARAARRLNPVHGQEETPRGGGNSSGRTSFRPPMDPHEAGGFGTELSDAELLDFAHHHHAHPHHHAHHHHPRDDIGTLQAVGQSLEEPLGYGRDGHGKDVHGREVPLSSHGLPARTSYRTPSVRTSTGDHGARARMAHPSRVSSHVGAGYRDADAVSAMGRQIPSSRIPTMDNPRGSHGAGPRTGVPSSGSLLRTSGLRAPVGARPTQATPYVHRTTIANQRHGRVVTGSRIPHR